MATHRTARELAREQITRNIVEEGRRQLAEHGAAALSLRSVARELGMVSSAVYRYVPSRDDLLTRLIVEAYDSLGAAVEAVAKATEGEPASQRWLAAARAVRSWAFAHPHEYALVYGSPVPGYAAPQTTVAPGTRVSLALIGIVGDAADARQLSRPRNATGRSISADLAADLSRLRGDIDQLLDRKAFANIDDQTTLDVIVAWTQLFGLVSFELFNQTRGFVVHHADLFDAAALRMADVIGLR
jgi:AcrR family transcriptional regulator